MRSCRLAAENLRMQRSQGRREDQLFARDWRPFAFVVLGR
jgi:hypothetical protein